MSSNTIENKKLIERFNDIRARCNKPDGSFDPKKMEIALKAKFTRIELIKLFVLIEYYSRPIGDMVWEVVQ